MLAPLRVKRVRLRPPSDRAPASERSQPAPKPSAQSRSPRRRHHFFFTLPKHGEQPTRQGARHRTNERARQPRDVAERGVCDERSQDGGSEEQSSLHFSMDGKMETSPSRNVARLMRARRIKAKSTPTCQTAAQAAQRQQHRPRSRPNARSPAPAAPARTDTVSSTANALARSQRHRSRLHLRRVEHRRSGRLFEQIAQRADRAPSAETYTSRANVASSCCTSCSAYDGVARAEATRRRPAARTGGWLRPPRRPAC